MTDVTALNADTLRRHPLPPITAGDKDERGSILIVAGSRDVAGAALLTALGAMRAGAGRLQIATAASAAPNLAFTMPEAMVIGLPEDDSGGFASSATDTLGELAGKVDVVVGGPGLKGNDGCAKLTEALAAAGGKLVLDAALLHALPKASQPLGRTEDPAILLPHSGEMASLLQCSADEIERDPVDAGVRCARRYQSLTLVKGVTSHIVTPDGLCFRYEGGGPGLGVSGSGDTLAGIVGGLLTRGADPMTALLWGVWCHGEAGKRLGHRIGTLGYLARELPGEVPAILRDGGMLDVS